MQVQEERIHNNKVRALLYGIPRVCNIIVGQQLDFIVQKMQGSWEIPAKRMITACYSNGRLRRRLGFHNKDSLVQNLKLLFAEVGHVHIDVRGSLAK